MTSNMAVIDSLTKCRIVLSPDFSCITFSNIMLSVFFATIIVMVIFYIYLAGKSLVEKKK